MDGEGLFRDALTRLSTDDDDDDDEAYDYSHNFVKRVWKLGRFS